MLSIFICSFNRKGEKRCVKKRRCSMGEMKVRDSLKHKPVPTPRVDIISTISTIYDILTDPDLVTKFLFIVNREKYGVLKQNLPYFKFLPSVENFSSMSIQESR